MDNSPIKLENILEQAPRWTFAGDYTLLQWMNQISQDLELRATKTTESLTKLSNNINSTNIALDNVANSMTTLQFGNQFVECRVQDDDETLTNGNDEEHIVESEHTPTSKEMLNTFLDNNLKVLRNCHEKYSIDLDDSDDEEDVKTKEKTCIYQPINPYNERPLPYIFGSKDWDAKWHVGLYENHQENSYSGDEISEAFSESSSTSHLDDNESFESNTEWASSNSIDNENINTNIEIKNASSLRGSQPIYPGPSSVPIKIVKQNKTTASETSTVSTPSSSLTKKSTRPTKQEELVAQKAGGMNSINSRNSLKAADNVSTNNKESTLQNKTQPQTFVNLFNEPPKKLEPTTKIPGPLAQNVVCPLDNNNISALKTQPRPPPPFVDLFAEPPEDIPSSTASSLLSSGQNTKRKTVNLFDDDDDELELAKDDLLAGLTKKQELVNSKDKQKNTLLVNVPKTHKSLFEDSDEEDDDFLNAFAKKSSNNEATKNSSIKTILFDKEFSEPSPNIPVNKSSRENSNNKLSLPENSQQKDPNNTFDDPKDNEDDFLNNKTAEDAIKKPETSKNEDAKLNKALDIVSKGLDKPKEKDNMKTTVNLFDDFEDIPKTDNLVADKKLKKINLFDDFDDEDGDDLFSTKIKDVGIKDISQVGKLKQNDTKSTVTMKEVNQTETKHSYSEKNLKNSFTSAKTLQHQLSKGDETDNNSDVFQKEHKNIDEDRKIDRMTSQVIENVTSVSENLVLANNDPVQVEDKLHSTEPLQSQSSLETPRESTPKSTKNEKPNTASKELNSNVPISSPSSKPVTTSTKQQIPSNKYDFSSILFSDEPPEDDDKFFETLTKTNPHSINTNYNVIDLENDMYEPDLPNVPVTSNTNNLSTTLDTRQTNLYTGLQLFSDIPPDDDDDGANDNGNHHQAPQANQTKRLHSVFYDDFNETLMALNQDKIEKDMPSHPIFSEEAPPINEKLNTDTSVDVMDHKVPDVKEDLKLKGSDNANDFKISLSKSVNASENLSSTKRPVSKLQMPPININVQALLPGANNSIRNAKENASKSRLISHDNDGLKPISTTSSAKVTPNEKIDTIRTAETKHILTSITKNRVKAPAARRPSTRRGRQENYRKGLIEEQQILQSDEDPLKNIYTQEQISTSENLGEQVEIKNATEIRKEAKKEILKEKEKDASIWERTESTTLNEKNETKNVNEETSKHLERSSSNKFLEDSSSKKDSFNIFERNPTTKETLESKEPKTKISLLFDDVMNDKEDDDDDLFKYIKASIKSTNKTIDNEKESELEATLQSMNSPLGVSSRTEDASKKILVFPTIDNRTAIKPNSEQPQPTKVNENIGQSHVITDLIKSQQIETKTKIIDQSLTNKAQTSFLDSDGDDEDLFKTTTQKSTTFLSNKEKELKAKAEFKSFLDSESDEDLKVAGLQSSKSTKPTALTSTKTLNTSSTTSKSTSNKLFSDSDTDSDDLFAKPASTKISKSKITTEASIKTQNQSKTQKKSSLFGEESEEDDFLTSTAKTSKKIVSKNPLKEKKPKENTSLFSDIDSDEDDLFNSEATKVTTTTATNIRNIKTPSTSKSVATAQEVFKSKTIADNPLSDLL